MGSVTPPEGQCQWFSWASQTAVATEVRRVWARTARKAVPERRRIAVFILGDRGFKINLWDLTLTRDIKSEEDNKILAFYMFPRLLELLYIS